MHIIFIQDRFAQALPLLKSTKPLSNKHIERVVQGNSKTLQIP